MTNKNLTKTGGIAALLASTVAIPMPSSAFNVVVQNTTSNSLTLSTNELGQSFINNPFSPNGSGTGIDVFLNSFTFGFVRDTSQSRAAGKTLSIFEGTGNGGNLRASSALTSTSTVSGISNPVTWTFANSVQLIETSTYTAVLRGGDPSISLSTSGVFANPYPNGTLTDGDGSEPSIGEDTVFRANFTLEPIPFEFNPAMGLGILGGVWLLRKRLKKSK